MKLASADKFEDAASYGQGAGVDLQSYFQLAQKLRGWGRIHAISMLKATNEEIRSWLLAEGWQNNIMPEYSAITIIKRTKLADLLQSYLSQAGQVELSEANRQKLPEIKTFIENSQLDNKWQLVELCNNIWG